MLKRKDKGFTLIELMIVVAIIGILAAIAIPNFVNFQMKAKTAEAKTNLGGIRTCLESYIAEFDRYISAAIYPRAIAALTKKKAVWDKDASGNFQDLGFEAAGSVYYSYRVTTPGGDDQQYSAEAYGDLDGDGTASTWRTMTGDPAINRIGTEQF